MRKGWKETSLGKVTTHFRGSVKLEVGVPYAAAGVMMEGRGLIDREPFIGGISGYTKLTPIAPGQLVLRSVTAWEAPITVVPAGYIGRHVSGVFPVFTIDESQLNPGFMSLICQWPVFWNEMRIRATGSVLRRKTLNASQLQQIPLNLPPLEEQKRIVDVVSSVDAYIAALQQQADSARTARNALLSDLIEDSLGTEYVLGDVVRVDARLVDPTDEQYSNMLHIGVDKIQSSTGQILNPNTVAHDAVTSGKYLFSSDDVLFSKIRPELRKACFPGYTGLSSAEVYPLTCSSKVLPNFLLFSLLSDEFSREVISKSGRTKMPKVNRSELLSTKIILPDLGEQKRIVEIVSSVDGVIQSTEKAVVDAKNLRSGLLSDLLSGQHEIPESYNRLLKVA
jgi:type I restriction enzyme S subunit